MSVLRNRLGALLVTLTMSALALSTGTSPAQAYDDGSTLSPTSSYDTTITARDDYVTIWVGDQVVIDPTKNDTAADGSQVTILSYTQPSKKYGEVEDMVFTRAYTDSRLIIKSSGRTTGTFTFTYRDQSTSLLESGGWLTPYTQPQSATATVHVKVLKYHKVTVRKVKGKPAHIRVTNPNAKTVLMNFSAAGSGIPAPRYFPVRAHHTKVINLKKVHYKRHSWYYGPLLPSGKVWWGMYAKSPQFNQFTTYGSRIRGEGPWTDTRGFAYGVLTGVHR